MPQKLGIFVQDLTDPGRIFDFITLTRPEVVVSLAHDRAFWNGVKGSWPGLLLVGRIYLDSWDTTRALYEPPFLVDKILTHPLRGIYDAWMGINEPPRSWIDQLMLFEVGMAEGLHAAGEKYVGFSWSTGVPEVADWQRFDVREACRKVDYFAVHEYSAPRMDNGTYTGPDGKLWGWHTLRYRSWYPGLPFECKKPLLILETGIDGGVTDYYEGGKSGWKHFTNAEDYVGQLKWYKGELDQDSYVKGAAIFLAGTLDPQWQPFNLLGEALDRLQGVDNGEPPPPPPEASVAYWADFYNVTPGQCTILHWRVSGVKAIYWEGQGKTGSGDVRVCPVEATTYTLHVIFNDGSTQDYPIRITVGEIPDPVEPPPGRGPLGVVAYLFRLVANHFESLWAICSSIFVLRILAGPFLTVHDRLDMAADGLETADRVLLLVVSDLSGKVDIRTLSDAIGDIWDDWTEILSNPSWWVAKRLTEISQEAVDFIYDPRGWLRSWWESYQPLLYFLATDPDGFFSTAYEGRLYMLYFLYSNPAAWAWAFIRDYLPGLASIERDVGTWLWEKMQLYFPGLFMLATDPRYWWWNFLEDEYPTLHYLFTDPTTFVWDNLTEYLSTHVSTAGSRTQQLTGRILLWLWYKEIPEW